MLRLCACFRCSALLLAVLCGPLSYLLLQQSSAAPRATLRGRTPQMPTVHPGRRVRQLP